MAEALASKLGTPPAKPRRARLRGRDTLGVPSNRIAGLAGATCKSTASTRESHLLADKAKIEKDDRPFETLLARTRCKSELGRAKRTDCYLAMKSANARPGGRQEPGSRSSDGGARTDGGSPRRGPACASFSSWGAEAHPGERRGRSQLLGRHTHRTRPRLSGAQLE